MLPAEVRLDLWHPIQLVIYPEMTVTSSLYAFRLFTPHKSQNKLPEIQLPELHPDEDM